MLFASLNLEKLVIKFLWFLGSLIFFNDAIYAADQYVIRPPGLVTATKTAQTISSASNNKIRAVLNEKKLSKPGQLYYFISFSMADSLIKSYMQEAANNKGILVLRGISPGMNLHDFFIKKLLPLMLDEENQQAARSNIEINPNLFVQYAITTVPTLVYSLVPAGLSCQPIDTKLYWKLSGPVTGAWAMQRFQEVMP